MTHPHHPRLNQLREMQIADLLRDTASPLAAEPSTYLHDAVALITGAGGTVGAELCRQIAAQLPRALVMLDRDAQALHHIHTTVCSRHPHLNSIPVVADIRDPRRVGRVLARHTPAIVFHAADYKHVALMEHNPEEAVLTSVLGTRNLLRAAEQRQVTTFVLISTVKAVNPASFIGAGKRVAELLVQDAARRSGRHFIAVRFGNLFGSAGSVVPLFKRQIAAGGPLTVTHPDAARYFITTPRAVQLLIQAADLGQGGEIFVLDMGEPVKIIDLARDMIARSERGPQQTINIRFTGLRPGEKLTDACFNTFETCEVTSRKEILVALGTPSIESARLQRGVEKLIRLAQNGEIAQLWGALQALAPECQRALSEAS